MDKITCGSACLSLDVRADGIGTTHMRGLLCPGNAAALSARALAAGVERGASGVLSLVDKALVALPPLDPGHYRYVPAGLRRVPVALVVSPEQLNVYGGVTQAAAAAGTLRRAFLSREDAEGWLREQVRAIAANQAWWSGQRLPEA